MQKTGHYVILGVVLLGVLLAGCAPAPNAEPPTGAADPIQPADTIQPTDTVAPTQTAEPTSLPGEVIYPVESLQFGIPWLPIDKTKIPMLVYYGFNVNQPPFNIPEVRQAFALALDNDVLTLIYAKRDFYSNEVATRTVIPPDTLSRDISSEIGLAYDPVRAKELLTTAGYSDPSSFPATTLLIIYPKWSDYPGIGVNAATEAIRMWQENLGITVKMEVKGLEGDILQQQRELIQSGQYQIFEHGVWVNNNDPDEFVTGLFTPDGYNYLTGFDSARVTTLISAGASEVDPTKRLPIYIELERLLSEQELPIIPIFHCTVDGSGW